MKFSDLHAIPPGHRMRLRTAAAIQRLASRRFPATLQAKGLRLADLARPRPHASPYLLIGVEPSYSQYDLKLLDDVCTAIAENARDVVEFFDMRGTSLEQLEAVIPGIPEGLFHSPVVGLWIDGKLESRESGFRARQFVRMRYLGHGNE